MAEAMDTVAAYYAAFGSKDWAKFRALLSDDFTFQGALMSFDSPDAFVAAMQEMGMEGAPEGSRFIVDGTRVAHVFLWKMTAPAKADIPMCEVFESEGGKIRSSELFYDSKLFPAAA